MLMRFDPFRDLDRLTDSAGWNRRTSLMGLDAYRDGDHVAVHFDLPGIDPDSIDITVEKSQLTVSAERHWTLSDSAAVIASERPQGTFSRSLFLGEGLDLDRIEADYTNGVLTLTVPVAEAAKPRKITVGTGQTALNA